MKVHSSARPGADRQAYDQFRETGLSDIRSDGAKYIKAEVVCLYHGTVTYSVDVAIDHDVHENDRYIRHFTPLLFNFLVERFFDTNAILPQLH